MDNQHCAQAKRTRHAGGNLDVARKQQDATVMRPLMGSQQSPASSSGSSQRSSTSNKNGRRGAEHTLDTPCKQIAELKLHSASKKTKSKKKLLATTRSLSQLLPGRFFSKKVSTKNEGDSDKPNRITTTRSFPNGAFQFETTDQDNRLATNSSEPSLSIMSNIDSASTIGLPPQSASKQPALSYPSSSTLRFGLEGLSPIVAGACTSQNEMIRRVVASTPTLRMRCPKVQDNQQNQMRQQQHEEAAKRQTALESNQTENQETKTKTKSKQANKYKPFKNTALVLRDVKNSLGLRMKASHESQAFAKLREEIATPPTKLYSPFNIDSTPSVMGGEDVASAKDGGQTKGATARTKRLNKSRAKRERVQQMQKQSSSLNDSGLDCSVASTVDSASCNQTNHQDKTPKFRIALRHKKHLLQATGGAFASFYSPTGRLRETVRDVEQFQQCIEDISEAIRTRGGGGGQTTSANLM